MIPDFSDPTLKAVSFDLFDTLIQRAVAQPRDVFALMEPRVAILSGGAIQNFQVLRPQAERLTRLRRRASAPRREVTLGEIYQTLVDLRLLTSETAGLAMAEEMAVERRLLARREAGLKLLGAARAAGRRIVLVSDMYLPEDFVREVLAELNIGPYAALYLSSTRRAMKYYGGLFRTVLEREGLAPHELLHVGDNEKSDVEVPAGLGIRTFHLPKALDDFKSHGPAWFPKGWPDATFPGASLFPSLALGLTAARFYGDPDRTVPAGSCFGGDPFHLGYAALGPAAAGFALWLAGKARADGVRELFFLSRDGSLLKQAFDLLVPRLPLEVKTHYLHNSRKAVLTATLNNAADLVDAVMGYFQPVTLGRWLDDKFGLAAEAIPPNVRRRLALGRVVTMGDRDFLLPLVLDDLAPVLYARAAERRALWREYLSAAGFLAAGRKAVVDIGFSGAVQASLADLADDRDLRGYYVITDYRAGRPVQNGLRMDSFFEPFTDTFSGQFPHKYLYHCHFETFFKDGREGALDGLAKGAGGRPVPLFRPLTAPRNQEVGTAVFQGAAAFARDLGEKFGPWLMDMPVNPYSAAQAYLAFLTAPTALDAAVMRGLVVDDSFCGTDVRYFLTPEGTDPSASAWAEGAAALAGSR